MKFLKNLISIYESLQPQVKAFIIDSFSRYIKIFAKNLDDFIESSDTSLVGQWRNCLKVYIFFMEWIVESYLNQVKGKKKVIKKARRKIKQAENLNILSTDQKNNSTNTKRKSKKHIVDSDINKLKETPEKKEGEEEVVKFENLLKSLLKLSTCNLKILFRNKIIEDDVLNILIKVSFDLLEISNEGKNAQNKEKVFEILQILITKFQTNVNIQILLIKLTTKIVNLIYNQETLVVPLSEFVVLAINGDSSMNKLAVDIIHEMSKTINEDENFDSQGLKNVGRFMVLLSEKSPKTIYNNIPILIKLFDCESYVIRNTLVEMIANVIIKILCNVDDIPDVDTRNNYLKTKEKFIDILFDRIYDKCGFCRSKVLSVFEKLCDNNTISVPNYLRLLTEASGRLRDERSQVRKRAISLISKIVVIYAAIFKSDRFLTYDEIKLLITNSEKAIEENTGKMKEIEETLIGLSKYGEIEDVNTNEKDIQKQEELENEKNVTLQEINKESIVIEYFDNYQTVLKSIDSAIPLIIQLLGSKNVTDVHESIELLIVLHKLRVSSSFQGVKKMLTLIMKPEESIKKKVIAAYQELFFGKDIPADLQAAYLIDLTVSLNYSEFTCLRELLKNLIASTSINMNLFKEVWRVLLRNPDVEINKRKSTTAQELHQKFNNLEIESRAALQIVNTAADYEPSVILNNSDLYIKHILSNLTKNKVNWLLIKESLIGLQKIYPMKKDIAELCLLKIAKTILNGYGTDDSSWYIASKELIDTIFQVVTNPEKITQYLIIKLSKPLFVTNLNHHETETHFMTQNIDVPHGLLTQGMEMENNNNNNNNIKKEEELNPCQLSQLIFVIGHVALNMVVYAEKLESNLKKKKAEKTTQSQNKTLDDIQNIAGGKEAEIDYDINLLHKIVEDEILYKNLLGKFAPLVINISHRSLTCSNEELAKNLLLYKSSILSLCKLMCISQKFCEDNLPFLFDLLASETIEGSLKLNVCAAFGDFINRFPNILQEQVSKFFSCLHSKCPQVRRYAMTVISHLVLNDMLKLKGEVVDICMLLDTDDEKLKDLVNLFFHEVNQKGNNVIYNVIPKALAKLSNEYKHLDYQQFQGIVKTLIKYVEKDKHTEALIDKLFTKLKNSVDVLEWRNTTYCLSQLNYSERHVIKLIDLYSTLKDKLEDDVVKENFLYIFNKFKKSTTGNTNSNKEQIEELEKKFFAGEKINTTKKGTDKNGQASNINVKINSIPSSIKTSKKRSKKRTFDQMRQEEEPENADSEKEGKGVDMKMKQKEVSSKKKKTSGMITRLGSRTANKKKKITKVVDDSEEDYAMPEENDSDY